MKIIADENIPLIRESCSGLGSVELLPGRAITNQNLRNADALFGHSITPLNESLLKGTLVTFVATATIGTDHVDTAYLAKAGIVFASAS